MNSIQVELQVPHYIQAGLATGAFERVGGVVRETDTHRIVAWLRDGLTTDSDSLRQPLNFASQSLTAMAGSGFVLNIALSSATLFATMAKLDQLSQQVAGLQGELVNQFQRDRDTRFRSALQAARDALETDNPTTRDQRLNQAREKLDDAELHFRQDFDEALQKELLSVAQHYLTRAMYATTSQIRTFLETEDFRVARRRLSEALQEYDTLSRRLVQAWLGKYPAVFFHNELTSEDVRRFLNIIQWLYEPEGKSVVDILVEDLRKDFWNPEVIDPPEADFFQNIVSPLRRLRGETSSAIKGLPHKLTQMEITIQNLRRFQGFELEVCSLRLMKTSFAEWERTTPDVDMFAVLVPEQALELQT